MSVLLVWRHAKGSAVQFDSKHTIITLFLAGTYPLWPPRQEEAGVDILTCLWVIYNRKGWGGETVSPHQIVLKLFIIWFLPLMSPGKGLLQRHVPAPHHHLPDLLLGVRHIQELFAVSEPIARGKWSQHQTRSLPVRLDGGYRSGTGCGSANNTLPPPQKNCWIICIFHMFYTTFF